MTDHPNDKPANEGHDFVRVDVRGKSPSLWAAKRAEFINTKIPQLIEMMNKFLDTTIDYDEGTTIREEAKRFTSGMLEFARNKLRKEGVEVEKIEAEISEIYAKRLESIARTEKTSSETREKQRSTALKQLCTQLALTRGMLIGDDGEEAMLFGRQIDEFLRLVKELNLIAEG
ncbi:MAG: hypothetical protein KF757_07390 [Phycisphaeraceae bacterium]|nr:hypothetical protein [Phycisphaeraceae bacterium]